MCKIFNANLSISYFPDLLKIARVVPIFKSGNSKIISNYRPISNLTHNYVQNYRKIMYNRLSNYLTKNNFLTFSQHGFSASLTTTTALVNVTSYINAAVSNKEYCIALYMDINKAFDCIYHKILLMKLARTISNETSSIKMVYK